MNAPYRTRFFVIILLLFIMHTYIIIIFQKNSVIFAESPHYFRNFAHQ